MLTENDLLKTVSLNAYKTVNSLCLPLKNIGVYHVSFCRIFNDGTKIYLTNYPELMVQVFTKLYDLSQINGYPNNYSAGFHLWKSGILDNSLANILSNEFDIAHGITLINKQKEACDIFLLGSKQNNEDVYNSYLNNTLQIKLFCFAFLEQNKSLIQRCYPDRFILPKAIQRIDYSSSPILDISTFDQIPVLVSKKLSEQENICLQHLITGKTAKEIAKRLEISPRTIETYIKRAKLKLSCSNSNDLIAKFIINALLTE